MADFRKGGAGSRTRTGTGLPPRDFKSLVSTYSTMPAQEVNHIAD